MGISRRDFILRSIAFGGGTLALTAAGRYFWISADDKHYTFSGHALAYSNDKGYKSRVFIQGAGSWLARNGVVRDFPMDYKLFFANTKGEVIWTKEGIVPPLTSLTIDVPPLGFGSLKAAFGCPKEQILEVQPEVGGFFVQETPFGSDGLHMAEAREGRGFTRLCGMYPLTDEESLVIGFSNTSMVDTAFNLRIADAEGKTIYDKVVAIPKFGSHRLVAGPKLADDPFSVELPKMAPGAPFIFHLSNSTNSTFAAHAWIVDQKNQVFTTYHGSVEKSNLGPRQLADSEQNDFESEPMKEVFASHGWWCADLGASGKVNFANESFESAILMSNYTGADIETYHAVLGFDGNLVAKTSEKIKIPKDGILHLPLNDKRFVWEPNAERFGMIISHFGLSGRQSVAYAKVVTTTPHGRFMQHYRPNEHLESRPKWLGEIESQTANLTDYWVSGCHLQNGTKNVVAVRSFAANVIRDAELQIITSRGTQMTVPVPMLPPFGAVGVSLDSLNGKIGDELAAIRLVSTDGYLRHTLMVKVGDRNWTARHGTSRLQEQIPVKAPLAKA